MTNKQIAERLRTRVTDHYDAVRLADELDPPRPEPGTVVENCFGTAPYGIVSHENDGNVIVLTIHGAYNYNEQWKPARILAPDEVAVKVPPMWDWPTGGESIDAVYETNMVGTTYYDTIITRVEAERMEAER